MTPSEIGMRLAARAFDIRGRGRRQRGVELHVSEAELAAMLAVAAEQGARLVTSASAETAAPALERGTEGFRFDASTMMGRRYELDGEAIPDVYRWAMDNALALMDLRAIAGLGVGEQLDLGGGAGAIFTLTRAA